MGEHRRALVVAIDRYAHPTLRALRAPTTDAAALADVLGDPHLGGFDVSVLSNASSWEVAAAVEQFLCECSPSDLLLLHFSCHGIKDERGELFLAASNTIPNRLVSTAVDSSLVSRLIQRSRAQRVILLLDCCYGGAFERGVVARSTGDVDIADQFAQGLRESGRGRVVITASSAMEYAFEGAELSDQAAPRPSLFTGALVQGIRTGEADMDQDGQVALRELYEYVHDKVRERTPDQTPSKWEFGVQGELYVASNPHRRISAAPLSPELVELISHQHSGVRLTAVHELDQLASGTRLRLAAGACDALRQLTVDDSRRVATAAEEALARTALRVTPTEIDLGTRRSGDVAVTQARLDGVPLALASMVSTSAPLLRAWIDGSTLHMEATVEAGADDTGTFSESVTLDGPAGAASVRVLARVASPAVRPTEPVEPTAPAPATPPVQLPQQPARASSAPWTEAPTERLEPATEPEVTEPEPTEPHATKPASTDRIAAWSTEGPAEPAPRRDELSLTAWVVVAVLAVAGAAVTWWSMVRTPGSDELLKPFSGTDLRWLGLSAPTAILGVVALRRPAWQPVGAGMILGAGLWMGVLWGRLVEQRLRQQNIDVHPIDAVQAGSLLRLLGAITLAAAGVIAIGAMASLRARVGLRRDRWAMLGGIIAIAGVACLQATWLGHAPARTQTVAMALFFGWVPWCAFNDRQRRVALATTASYVVCSAARDVVTLLQMPDAARQRVVVVLGLALLLAGVALSQWVAPQRGTAVDSSSRRL